MTMRIDIQAEVLRLFHAERWKIGTIAAQLGIHHSAVRRVRLLRGALAQRHRPLRHGRPPVPSLTTRSLPRPDLASPGPSRPAPDPVVCGERRPASLYTAHAARVGEVGPISFQVGGGASRVADMGKHDDSEDETNLDPMSDKFRRAQEVSDEQWARTHATWKALRPNRISGIELNDETAAASPAPALPECR